MKAYNLECVCKHEFRYHYNEESSGKMIMTLKHYGDHWCEVCSRDEKSPSPFHTFQMDKLKYLESKYDSIK